MMMRLDLFCIRCGGSLSTINGQVECLGCGALYSDVLISESVSREGDLETREFSVCMDITTREVKQPPCVDEVLELGPRIELGSALSPQEALAQA
jgi:hypothetical protein